MKLAYSDLYHCRPSQLKILQDEIVVILCELEIYFPLAFFDICVHLLPHVVDDIRQLEQTFLHYMMSFERQNGAP